MGERGMGGGFEIDLAGVLNFSSQLRNQVNQHLATENETAARSFIAVPSFGTRSASPDVQAAAHAYHQQLIRLLDLADTFAHNASVMAQAAGDVVAAYHGADSLSADSFFAVLKAAADKVDQAAADAQRAAIDPATGVPL